VGGNDIVECDDAEAISIAKIMRAEENFIIGILIKRKKENVERYIIFYVKKEKF
jgi:hypothetical protein